MLRRLHIPAVESTLARAPGHHGAGALRRAHALVRERPPPQPAGRRRGRKVVRGTWEERDDRAGELAPDVRALLRAAKVA